MFYVYIVKCADGKFYTGSARGDLDRRIAEHNDGTYTGWTSKRLPVALVYQQQFDNPYDMIAAEQQIKGWTVRKKQALIDGRYDDLPKLSKRKKKLAAHPSRPLRGASG